MGPTVGVLLPYPPNGAEKAAILAVSNRLDVDGRSASEFVIRGTAAIGGCVFAEEQGGSFGIFLADPELELAESEAVSKFCGFAPLCEIQLVAFTNGLADHRRLGELALFMTKQFGGVVDFGGELDGSVVLEKLDGRQVSIPYTTSSETQAVYHIGDAAFLEAWLSNPEFHMVK